MYTHTCADAYAHAQLHPHLYDRIRIHICIHACEYVLLLFLEVLVAGFIEVSLRGFGRYTDKQEQGLNTGCSVATPAIFLSDDAAQLDTAWSVL